MKTRRTTVADINNEKFFKLHKSLFYGQFKGLNNDVRVLYSVLLDRHELSKNNGWINEHGNIYFLYTQDNLAKLMGISVSTIKRNFKTLMEYGLIETERQGLNKPNKIFVMTIIDNENRIDNGSINLNCQGVSERPPNETELNETEILSKKVSKDPSGSALSTDDPSAYKKKPEQGNICERLTETYGEQATKKALSIIDEYIEEAYPKVTGKKHKKLSKPLKMAYAEKLLECVLQTGASPKTVTAALSDLLKNSNSNKEIFYATTPKVLGYWLLRQDDIGFESLKDTIYQPVDTYY